MSHLSTIIQRVKKQADLQNEENLKSNVEDIRDYIEAWNDYTERELIEAYSLWHKYAPRLEEYDELPLDNTSHIRIIPKEDIDLQELSEQREFDKLFGVQKSVIMEVEDDGEL